MSLYILCFNPCFIGTYSITLHGINLILMLDLVLILVLLELTLLQIIIECLFCFIRCFNPCFIGTYSITILSNETGTSLYSF